MGPNDEEKDAASDENAAYDEYDEDLDPILVSSLLTDKNSDRQLRQIVRELYKTVFENVEQGITHNPYSHERMERDCIRTGDVEGLRTLLETSFPGRYGKISEDPVRQAINHGIVSVTLSSRAAIDGGLHYETAFYLSDICIQRLDRCRTVESADAIHRGSQILYAELVRELNNERDHKAPPKENLHVSRCKDYIFAHVYEKITVKEIADAVGLDANYLSSLFKRCEKMTLSQFIMNEKIRLARNMLTYSDYSYSEIAANLGFCSQSHLGSEFKKYTGMTLRAYRDANTIDDFVRASMEK